MKAWLRQVCSRWLIYLFSKLALVNWSFLCWGADLSTELLEHPHNMVTDFPQSDWSKGPTLKLQYLSWPSLLLKIHTVTLPFITKSALIHCRMSTQRHGYQERRFTEGHLGVWLLYVSSGFHVKTISRDNLYLVVWDNGF